MVHTDVVGEVVTAGMEPEREEPSDRGGENPVETVSAVAGKGSGLPTCTDACRVGGAQQRPTHR